MSKKKSIRKGITRLKKEGKIPSKATELKEKSYDDMKPYISFSYVDNTRWQLSKWKGNELTDLIKCFKKMESMSWSQIKVHSGLRYKSLTDPPNINNDNISEDVTICEMRVCDVKRIHGFRDKNVFCIVWFDRDHSVCPEGKNRKHG